MHVRDAIKCCATCRGSIGDIRETHEALLEMTELSASEKLAIRDELKLDGPILDGMVNTARYACYVLDWLALQNVVPTPSNIHEVKSEMDSISQNSQSVLLSRDLRIGAALLLRLVRWD
jgi:hypothetical protein